MPEARNYFLSEANLLLPEAQTSCVSVARSRVVVLVVVTFRYLSKTRAGGNERKRNCCQNRFSTFSLTSDSLELRMLPKVAFRAASGSSQNGFDWQLTQFIGNLLPCFSSYDSSHRDSQRCISGARLATYLTKGGRSRRIRASTCLILIRWATV